MLLGNQLAAEHFHLLYLVVPICGLSNLYSILLIFLQRKAVLKLPNMIGILQLGLLLIQIFVSMSAVMFLTLEIFFFGFACLLGLVALHAVYKQDKESLRTV
jgi:hypothetical protein